MSKGFIEQQEQKNKPTEGGYLVLVALNLINL